MVPGFNGIVVALFGQLHPLGAIPASFLFGALIVGANKLQRVMQVPSSFIIALNGLVVIFVVSADYWRRRLAQRREADVVGEMTTSSEAEVPT
jgi:simple sugar transport system permease protein